MLQMTRRLRFPSRPAIRTGASTRYGDATGSITPDGFIAANLAGNRLNLAAHCVYRGIDMAAQGKGYSCSAIGVFRRIRYIWRTINHFLEHNRDARLAILVLLVLCAVCPASPPKSTGEFSEAVRRAFNAHDSAQIQALTWKQNVADASVGDWEQKIQRILAHFTQVGTITYKPMPDEMSREIVLNGERSELSYKPAGMLEITDRSSSPNLAHPMIPYAVIDGVYYLLIRKVTKIEWQGPPDKTFSVIVLGKGFNKVKTHTRYNASGVDQEIDGNTGFPAQYIDEVTVTSQDAGVDVTLKILQGSELIYQSKPLKGRGRIVYKKGDRSP